MCSLIQNGRRLNLPTDIMLKLCHRCAEPYSMDVKTGDVKIFVYWRKCILHFVN